MGRNLGRDEVLYWGGVTERKQVPDLIKDLAFKLHK